MKNQEVAIRIIERLDLSYGNVFNQQEVKQIIETVLYDYDVTQKETALALTDNMQDKILWYIATKNTEGLSEGSLKQYGSRLKRFSDYIRKDVENITAMDIRMYLANFAKTGVKKTTMATETDILRGFFTWLENEEYTSKSPMRKVKTVKVEKRIREALTKKELEILRGGAKTFRQKAILEVLYATGARLEEIENMKKDDVNWQNLQINVIGKGDKERTVYLNATAQVHLKKYIMSRLDDCDFLFVTERKPIKFLGKRAIQREINKIAEQSGLSINVYPHLLRHSMATHLLNSGMDITVLQGILGHDDVSTTLIYAAINNSTVEHEYRKYS